MAEQIVGYKVLAECPVEHRPVGVSLAYPWIVEYVRDDNHASQLYQAGYILCTLDQFNRYCKSCSLELTVAAAVEASIDFGWQVLREFSTENVLLGITQAGMTNRVRQVTMEVINALSTGSLYDAIAQAKAIPPEHKDPVFITDARLVKFINKVEEYLGLPLSTTL